MKTKREKIRIYIVIFLLLLSLASLYYFFFIEVDSSWMFWRKDGENIAWDDIEYDEDFFPLDTVEVYGEFGEWKFKEFRPIYAGYGITEDGLNYLIGKYLNIDGKEKTMKILVSGEGMVEWPYPDNGLDLLFNGYFKKYVAIRGKNWDPIPKDEIGDLKYTEKDQFRVLPSYEQYACPEEVVVSRDVMMGYLGINEEGESTYEDFFVEQKTFEGYCNLYNMYYNTESYVEVLHSFEETIEELGIGDQIAIRYLETDKAFKACKYEYDGVEKIFCANQYLNETYEGFLVGIYIELD